MDKWCKIGLQLKSNLILIGFGLFNFYTEKFTWYKLKIKN